MSTPEAAVLIRQYPQYRREAFIAGLSRHGYRVSNAVKAKPEPDDVVVIWNRYEHYDFIASRYEKAGAKVLVVENGYVGLDKQGIQLYAIARNHHNGAGSWTVGDHDRWAELDIGIRRWRRRGTKIVVLPQRGIGPPGIGMPKDWPLHIVRRLRRFTDRPVVIRPHPGKLRPPLEPDLDGAWAAVTWGSGAAIKALVYGIPVFHELERWIGGPASKFGIEGIEDPFLGDRIPMFRSLAWAQWRVSEIAAGEPFEWLK